MADVRIPPQTAIAAQLGRAQALARPEGVKAEAIRAAQRAFFDAAMNQQPAAAPATASPGGSSVGRVQPTTQANTAEPSRFARPGSVLDIKV